MHTKYLAKKIETQLKTLLDKYEKDMEDIKTKFYSQEHGNKTLSDLKKDLDEQRKILQPLSTELLREKKTPVILSKRINDLEKQVSSLKNELSFLSEQSRLKIVTQQE